MTTITIYEASKELSKREQFKVKDLFSTLKLDKETAEGNEVEINVDYYAKLKVQPDDGEGYSVIVLVDKNGSIYSTGSTAFMNSFDTIVDVMEGEPFGIIVFKRESKRTGKMYIACTLA